MSRMGYSQADHDAVFRVWVDEWLKAGGLDERPAVTASRRRLRAEGLPCPSKPTLEAWMAAGNWLERARKIRQERQASTDRRVVAETISGQGREAMVEDLTGQILPAFQLAIQEVHGDTTLSSFQKAKVLSELATAMDRSMSALGKASPAIDRLGIAQKVVYLLADFVQEQFPQHSQTLLEIMEPLGRRLVDEFAR